MNSAFLFDIDGCLTLPGYNTSVLDIDLLDTIYQLSNPVALVTGRSDGWLRKHYTEANKERFLQLPTYIEFGLAYLQNARLGFQDEKEDFLNTRDFLINAVADLCKEQDIFFQKDIWYDDFPNHGSLWVEKKYRQLSIAANKKISSYQVHQLVDMAWQDMKNQARVLHHHLGVDVVPNGWTKAKATQHFIQDLDEQDYQWYVFGDNQSDQEMTRGLTNVEFISTKENASLTVRQKLHDLDILTIDTTLG